MDAPPTGRVVTFLGVTEAMADLAKRGPIHSQAEGVVRLLHSPDTIVHLVTLLEDMPVTETLEAIASSGDGPAGRHDHRQRRDRAPAAAGVADAAADGRLDTARLAAGLAQAGIAADPELVDGLATQAAEHAIRVLDEADCRAQLAAAGAADAVAAPAGGRRRPRRGLRTGRPAGASRASADEPPTARHRRDPSWTWTGAGRPAPRSS